MAESRRVRLTKRCISDALIELLKEKALYQISVRELCARADVNRSTFYAHYSDLHAVLEEMEEQILGHTAGIYLGDTVELSEQGFTEYLLYLQKHSDEFLALFKQGFMVEKACRDAMDRYIAGHAEISPVEIRRQELVMRSSTIGSFCFVADWLQGPADLTPLQVRGYLMRLHAVNQQAVFG